MSSIAARASLSAPSPRIAASVDRLQLALPAAEAPEAAAHRDAEVLSLEPLGAKPKDILKSIDWGTQVATSDINVYFAGFGETFDGERSLGWKPYEIKQAMEAFEQFENVINVNFTQVDNAADADFNLVIIQNADYLGYFNPPGTSNEGVGVFVRSGSGWDENGNGGLEQGGYGFITMIHEFGHGMGLAHPHDTGGTSTVMTGVSGPFGDFGAFDLNQGVFTTMSYNDGWETGPNGNSNSDSYGWQGTMMALDIALLQQKYGANTNFHGGSDVYKLKALNEPGAMYSCIWDTGGGDTISYQGGANCVIDLRAATIDYSATGGGVVSYVEGVFGGYTIARGVVIERARAGGGDDSITGNEANNNLRGGGGDDAMLGGAGKDNILGEAGADTLNGGAQADKLYGGDGADRFVFADTTGADRIFDLDDLDTIDLSGLDADVGTAGDQAFSLVDLFSGEAGEARMVFQASKNVTKLLLDTDGDGGADVTILISGDHTDFSNFVL